VFCRHRGRSRANRRRRSRTATAGRRGAPREPDEPPDLASRRGTR
jgi:hypothetical protein